MRQNGQLSRNLLWKSGCYCGFEKNGHFVMNLGYLRNKDMFFWEKTPQIEI